VFFARRISLSDHFSYLLRKATGMQFETATISIATAATKLAAQIEKWLINFYSEMRRQ